MSAYDKIAAITGVRHKYFQITSIHHENKARRNCGTKRKGGFLVR